MGGGLFLSILIAVIDGEIIALAMWSGRIGIKLSQASTIVII